jgi:hypothetical protein
VNVVFHFISEKLGHPIGFNNQQQPGSGSASASASGSGSQLVCIL